ncbi:MAG: phospholipid/glycerol acyltransferase [Proteobacteria bacterium]|nr:phospholipid/glycerol acyltransferase [Pseudomonadota bacterium]
MLSARQWFKGALITGMFALGLLAVSVIMPLARKILGPKATAINDRIQSTWNWLVCRILGVRIHIGGQPMPEAGLTVANHISWLDIIVLGGLHHLTFVSKQEVADWPVMGVLARRIGTLFIKRGDAEQAAATGEQMAWLLRQGKHLMLFPEGTTTTGERVLRFHGKLFQPAQLAHVPVQPVAIRYLNEAGEVAPFIGEDEFLPHLINVLKLRHIDISLHYCTPLPAGLHRNVLSASARKQIVDALDAETGMREAASRHKAVIQL